MKYFFIYGYLLISSYVLLGQGGVAAYHNYKDHFFVFDVGKHTLVEENKVTEYKVGGEGVIYIDFQNNIKIFENGETHTISRAGMSAEIYATDYLYAYTSFGKLVAVTDNYKPVTLSNGAAYKCIRDSLILFYDEYVASLRVFYDNKVVEVESGLLNTSTPLDNVSCGDNTIAYISSRTGDFKIWYKGQSHIEINYAENLSFKAGKNIVAYFDDVKQNFNVYYKGKTQVLENFKPMSYQVGDDFVAYVDDEGELNYFYDGQKQNILEYTPESYVAKDELLLINDAGYFKAVYHAFVYELEAYIPNNYKADKNTIAYMDNSNRLWAFNAGEKNYISNTNMRGFNVYNDVILLNLDMNKNIIYYDGKMIDGKTY